MDGIKIEVVGNIARITDRPPRITAGTVGLPVEFSFDSQWGGLSKTAVFRAGRVEKIAEGLKTEATIPWEVLENPKKWLSIGVYGVNADGTVAIPTIWANVCVICEGVNPDGDVSAEPTLPVWQRLWNAIGNLVGLKTNAKDNLVDAINEVHNIALAGSIESDPTLSVSGKAADAKATGDLIQAHTDDKNNPHGVTIAKIGAAPAGVGFGENMLSRSSSGDGPTMATSGESLESFQAKLDRTLSTMPNHSAKLMLVRGVSTAAGNLYDSCGNCLGIIYRGGSENEAWLIAFSYQSSTKGSQWRMQKSGTWVAPEWEHPPMKLGVEYRTTERYNEKPVYKKLVSFGALPNAGQRTEPHNISASKWVRCSLVGAGGTSMMLDFCSTITNVSIDSTKIYINTSADLSYISANVQIWYTK